MGWTQLNHLMTLNIYKNEVKLDLSTFPCKRTLHEAAIDKLRQCEKQCVYIAKGDTSLILACNFR